MTIFLEIAKQFISEEIQKIRSDSLAADASPLNTVLTFFSYGRDIELSAEKRQLLDELMPRITTLTDGVDDEASHARMIILITEYRERAAVKSAERQYDEGVFGAAMQNVVNLLKGIYDKINKLDLLNIPHDDDPLNKFRYFASMYCVKKVVKAHRLNLWERLKEHPKVTDTRKFSNRKEDLVREVLNICNQEIDVLDMSHPLYAQSRTKRVLECIHKLIIKNQELCHAVKVPVVGMNLPGAHPSYGFLEVCMNNAISAIDPLSMDPLSREGEPLKPPKAQSDGEMLRRGSDASRKMPGTGSSTPVSLSSLADAEMRAKDMRDMDTTAHAELQELDERVEAFPPSPPIAAPLRKEDKALEQSVAPVVTPLVQSGASATVSANSDTFFSNTNARSKKKKGAPPPIATVAEESGETKAFT